MSDKKKQAKVEEEEAVMEKPKSKKKKEKKPEPQPVVQEPEEAEAVMEKPKSKKKKEKKSEPEPEDEPAESEEVKEEKAEPADPEQGDADEELPGLDLDLKKKKKKKKPQVVATETSASESKEKSGDHAPWEGSDRDYSYTEMLERVFELIRERNPSLAEKKRHVMPPPQLVRVGTRKTMWANFEQICQTMRRNTEHVMSFVLAELGTEGSIDGNQRLVIKGRYVPKQIESLLKKYIVEYVTCHMCRHPETTLTRDSVTRLYFLQCESCSSRRSVAPIKSGFHATNRTDRRRVLQAP